MTADGQMGPTLRSWLHATSVAPPDAREQVGRVMARLPQRSRAIGPWSAAILTRPGGPAFPNRRLDTLMHATTFTAAGLVVALFGGLLALGLLGGSPREEVPAAIGTSPGFASPQVIGSPRAVQTTVESDTEPDPTSASLVELLPGVRLLAEEIRPGLFNVIEDEHGHRLDRARTIAMAPDGTVWVHEKDQRFSPAKHLYQLGAPGIVDAETDIDGHFAIDGDGVVWFATDAGLGAYDGTTWTTHDTTPYTGIATAVDGSLWALRGLQRVHISAGRVDPREDAGSLRRVIVDGLDDSRGGAAIAPDGRMWRWGSGWSTAVGTNDPKRRVSGGLLHFDGTRWASQQPLGDRQGVTIHSLQPGPDGTAWALVDIGSPHMDGAPPGSRRIIAYFDGTAWTRSPHRAAMAQVPSGASTVILNEVTRVDDDGTPWIRHTARDFGSSDRVDRGWLTLDEGVWVRRDDVVIRERLFTTSDGDIWERARDGRVLVRMASTPE